jgi:hypothetical protein
MIIVIILLVLMTTNIYLVLLCVTSCPNGLYTILPCSRSQFRKQERQDLSPGTVTPRSVFDTIG